jgi:acyl-CoA thioester hydrolase
MDTAAERFELPITIGSGDIDELGHVINVVYVRWVQDVAVAHGRSAATEAQQAEISPAILKN